MARGWVNLDAVGIIDFSYKLIVTEDELCRHCNVQLEMAWFRDSGLVIPQAEHDWVVDMILDTILEGQSSKAGKEIPEMSDPNFIHSAEYYLGN